MRQTIAAGLVLAAFLTGAAGASAQGVSVAPPPLDVLDGTVLAADCGNMFGLAGNAFCVTAPLAGMETASRAYVEHQKTQGWLVAEDNERHVVFVRRKDGGDCEMMQMLAYYDRSKPAAADTPGYLAFSLIPGGGCRAESPVSAPAQ